MRAQSALSLKQHYRQFWLRKLHSLTGGVFLGLFVVVHICFPGTNLFGRGFLPKLLLFSLPLLFHVAYGLYICSETKLPRYPYVSNWRYLAQRFSALTILFFLPIHLYVMSVQASWIHHWLYLLVWVLGTVLTLYHLFNGFAGLLIHWGVTVGPKSQRAVLVLLLVLGGVFLLRAVTGIAELTGSFSFVEPIKRILF